MRPERFLYEQNSIAFGNEENELEFEETVYYGD
jgi:guanyl-specific ribonuclease Sa